jgi:hypothetical protein
MNISHFFLSLTHQFVFTVSELAIGIRAHLILAIEYRHDQRQRLDSLPSKKRPRTTNPYEDRQNTRTAAHTGDPNSIQSRFSRDRKLHLQELRTKFRLRKVRAESEFLMRKRTPSFQAAQREVFPCDKRDCHSRQSDILRLPRQNAHNCT